MKTSASNRRLRMLLLDIKDDKLIPRPEFQRRLVWTNADKIKFLETVLSGFPFPEIYIAAGDVDPETGVGTEMLVDGQQRITTLYEYFIGSRNLRYRDGLVAYTQLSDEKKLEFLEYDVVVRDLGKLNIEEIKEIFTRINSTKYSLNAMEINHARYNGVLKEFAEEIADHALFEENKVFSPLDARRMGDIRFALSIIITIMSTYFNRDDELEEYLREYNDQFDEKDKLKEELESVFEYIQSFGFDIQNRIWKKSDLFTLIVELHRALFIEKLDLDHDRVRNNLYTFYSAVDEYSHSKGQLAARASVIEYDRYALQATNDRHSRIARGRIIEHVIKYGDFY